MAAVECPFLSHMCCLCLHFPSHRNSMQPRSWAFWPSETEANRSIFCSVSQLRSSGSYPVLGVPATGNRPRHVATVQTAKALCGNEGLALPAVGLNSSKEPSAVCLGQGCACCRAVTFPGWHASSHQPKLQHQDPNHCQAGSTLLGHPSPKLHLPIHFLPFHRC